MSATATRGAGAAVVEHARLCGSLDVYLVRVDHFGPFPEPRWFVVQLVEGAAVKAELAAIAVVTFGTTGGPMWDSLVLPCESEMLARETFERIVG